jgi:uncharacterized protein YndB with AHSA1/START domain
MTNPATSTFVYVTFIRTTPERLWSALTDPQFTRQYWFGVHADTDWKAGSPWQLVFADGRVADTGEIVEADPPRRLVIKWRNEFRPELKAEGYSRCTMDLERRRQTDHHPCDGSTGVKVYRSRFRGLAAHPLQSQDAA